MANAGDAHTGVGNPGMKNAKRRIDQVGRELVLQAVVNALGLQSVIDDCKRDLLELVRLNVATEVVAQAIVAGDDSDLSKAAAACHMLGFVDPDDFAKLLDRRGRLLEYSDLRSGTEWKIMTPAQMTQAEAGMWIGLGHRSVREKKNYGPMFDAFACIVGDHVRSGEIRKSLLAIVAQHNDSLPVAHIEESVAKLEAGAVVATPSILSGRNPSEPRRALSPTLQRAKQELAESTERQLLKKLGTFHVSNDAPPLNIRYANVTDISGDHSENLCDRFDASPESSSRNPTRCVITGKSGAGKTVFLMQLALSMAANPDVNLIPIMLKAESWDPREVTLDDWIIGHVAGKLSSVSAEVAKERAVQLVTGGHILLIVDGLEKLLLSRRLVLLRTINSSLSSGAGIYISCRSHEYTKTFRAGGVLAGAEVLRLVDLRLEDAADYLHRTSAPIFSSRSSMRWTKWTRLFKRLKVLPDDESSRVIKALLASPRMVSLAREVYLEPYADPMELFDYTHFPDVASMAGHMWDKFVISRYWQLLPTIKPSDRSLLNPKDLRIDPDEAMQALKCLAVHLRSTGKRRFGLLIPGGMSVLLCILGIVVGLGAIGGALSTYLPSLTREVPAVATLTNIVSLAAIVLAVVVAIGAAREWCYRRLSWKWYYPRFLAYAIEDACRRGVLELTNGSYQFRDPELQDRIVYNALKSTGPAGHNRALWEAAEELAKDLYEQGRSEEAEQVAAHSLQLRHTPPWKRWKYQEVALKWSITRSGSHTSISAQGWGTSSIYLSR